MLGGADRLRRRGVVRRLAHVRRDAARGSSSSAAGSAASAPPKRWRRAPVDVLLIDRRNHHVFPPLLYQVATAGLSPGDIASPIRWILRRQKNLRVWLAEAVGIDRVRRRVLLTDGEVAIRLRHRRGGRPDHATSDTTSGKGRAPGLKTLEDALEIRRRVLLAFERAERELDRAAQRRLLTFVVVGGGADRRGAGRSARRDLTPCAGPRLSHDRSRKCADHPRSRAARPCCRPIRSRSRRSRAARSNSWAWPCGPGVGDRRFATGRCSWATRRLKPTRSCGRRALPPCRSHRRSVPRSIDWAGSRSTRI